MDPVIKQQYSDQFDAWWQAGGWKNFAGYLIATGQAVASDDERKDFLLDRVQSAANEVAAYLQLPHR